MEYRVLGTTGYRVSTISFGACAIPGGKRPSQVEENVAAAGLPPLDDATMQAVQAIYSRHFRALVQDRW